MNELYIKHCRGVYEQNTIVNSVHVHDWIIAWATIASYDCIVKTTHRWLFPKGKLTNIWIYCQCCFLFQKSRMPVPLELFCIVVYCSKGADDDSATSKNMLKN